MSIAARAPLLRIRKARRPARSFAPLTLMAPLRVARRLDCTCRLGLSAAAADAAPVVRVFTRIAISAPPFQVPEAASLGGGCVLFPAGLWLPAAFPVVGEFARVALSAAAARVPEAAHLDGAAAVDAARPRRRRARAVAALLSARFLPAEFLMAAFPPAGFPGLVSAFFPAGLARAASLPAGLFPAGLSLPAAIPAALLAVCMPGVWARSGY